MNYSYSFRKTIRKLRMTPLKKLLLRELAEFADEYGESIFPSLSLLQNHTGISRPWIIKLLKELCEEGYLIKLDNSFYRSNLYQLNLKFIEEQYILQTNSTANHDNKQDDSLVNPVYRAVNSVNHEVNSEVVNPVNPLVNPVNFTSKLSLPHIPYNYHLTNNTYVQKVNFSEKTEPIQKPELPVMEEKTVQPEKPVEAKKTSQQALPFPTKEIETVKKTAKTRTVSKKTRIDPDMELTPERIQVALDHGLHSSWIETEFNSFKKHYVENGKIRPGWDASWNSWAERAATIYNPNGMKSKPHPIKPSISLETSATTLSPPVVQVVEDQNLNKFLEAHQHLEGRFAFSGATMRKVGDEITISHPSQFSLDKIEMNSYKLKEFFKVSKIDFTTETVKKPVLVWPPKESVSTLAPDTDIQVPPATEIKPPRYRTLNESYHGSTAKSLGANLNAIQRSYQNKLQTKIG